MKYFLDTESHEYKKQANEHNALSDVIWNKELYEFTNNRNVIKRYILRFIKGLAARICITACISFAVVMCPIHCTVWLLSGYSILKPMEGIIEKLDEWA